MYKCMLGFMDEQSARNAYLSAFTDGLSLDRLRSMKRMHVSKLREWLAGWRYGEHPLEASQANGKRI